MLLPALSQARERARRASCINNMRQIGLSSLMYAGDYDGWMPPNRTDAMWRLYVLWRGNVWSNQGVLYGAGYVASPQLFYCPSAKTAGLKYNPAMWPVPTTDTYSSYIYYIAYGDHALAGVSPPSRILAATINDNDWLYAREQHLQNIVIMADYLYPSPGGNVPAQILRFNHGTDFNTLWIDGSVRQVPLTYDQLLATQYENAGAITVRFIRLDQNAK